MGGPDKGKFGLDPTDRQLIATGPHAYNDKNTYQVIITATDLAGRSATVTIDVTPSGGKTNPVVQGPSVIKYPENGTWQASTYTGTIADRTRDDVGWIISVVPGGGDGDFFDIDDDGVLTFAQPPDYEDGQRTYSFSIYAYDSNPPKGSSGATFYRVKVTVYDVDDLPEIDGPSAVDHPENTSEVHEYTVSGVDAGETVTWSPLSGADGGKFSLTDGLLAFVSPPDFETPASSAGANVYLVTIMVEVGSEMKTEDVRVTNVNEPPEFPSATTTRNVDENAEGGENIVGPVEATDPDADASLTYTLSGTYEASFSVVNYSGQLQTKAGVDYGAKSSHTVTVTATDPGGLTDTITVTITTSEENDAPVFDDTSLQTTLEVAENSPANTNVGSPITATDEDSNSLTYTLEGTGTDKDSFTIDNSGQIQTKSGETYDFETKASYSVTVKADDSNGGTDTIDVTIAVTNVEEAGAVTFDLTQPEAGIPLVATVTDPDGNVYTVTWEWLISDSANTGFNAISGQTLNSYTPTAADVGKYLKAKASYTDPEDSGKTAESVTTAAVTPGNTPPTFPDTGGTPNPMTFNIEENSVAATVVGTVSTTDSDSGDIPTYSLEGAPTQKDAFNAAFDLDTSTGAITVLADDSLDHETTPSYTFQVGVSDGKDAADQTDSAIDSTVSVTINVTDINEPPMFPDSENRLRTVAENTEAGQPVGDPFAATDPDEGATLTYILSVTDAASFEIDSSSGQLKTKAALDYETTPSYSVTVSVRDSKDDSGFSDTVTDDTIEVTITVTNVEEDGTVTFTNRTPQARIELTASVADPDVIVADSIIWQWAISDTSASNFADISGETNASYTPDDNDVGKYLRATATYTDGHGAAKTASGDSLAVSVAHNPNQPPTFTDDPNNHPITFSIAENTPAGQDIGTPVTATDPDPTDTIAYSLDPTSALVFQIGSANGQIQTEAALNFEATPKPIPRWDVHFGGLEYNLKDSAARHITFTLQWGRPTVRSSDMYISPWL